MKRKFVLLLSVLSFVAGGCYSCNSNHRQVTESENVSSTDSNFEPTGHAKLDSLLQLASVAKQDTTLALLYFQIADQYENNDPKKGKEYYLKLNHLSELLDWNRGRILFASAFPVMLTRENLPDSALVIVLNGLALARKENNEAWIADMCMNTGWVYYFKDWYETALRYYMEALPLVEHMNDHRKLGRLYGRMADLYAEISLPEKAIEYGEKAIALIDDNPYVFTYLASAYSDVQHYDKAKAYYEKALELCIQQNNNHLQQFIYLQLGAIAVYTYDLVGVETVLNKIVEISGRIDQMSYDSGYLAMLGQFEAMRGHFEKAEKHLLQALTLATERDQTEAKRFNSLLLAGVSMALHKYRENVYYLKEVELLDQAIATAANLRAAAEMEAKYETEKKDFQITALKNEKRFMTVLSISGGIVLFLALVAFFLLWRWTVQKKHLSEQQHQLAEARIHQLEQEKQLVATQSVLDGETRERARLARDLHDGLGSLLTGTKLSLLEMKQGVKLDFADVKRFDTALGLLDDSVKEMRRVAHHLMPDSLSRFGLKSALNDFCMNLPSVKYAYYGDESRLDPKLEVMIYRTIHELVNNALKHAKATQIMVQLIHEPDRIAFTVQDDGCGFDPAMATEGMGLQNVRTRIASYNGIFDIDSRLGEGTEINVELKNIL